jgi:hypothetical protein
LGDTLLYLTSLGVTLSGVFSYYSVVESNVLRIPTLLFILNGHLISYLLRENKRKRLYSSFFLLSLLLLLFIDVFKGKGLLLFPPEAGGEPGLIIGDFLLWLVVFRSYTLFSQATSFSPSCPPSHSLVLSPLTQSTPSFSSIPPSASFSQSFSSSSTPMK